MGQPPTHPYQVDSEIKIEGMSYMFFIVSLLHILILS